VVIHRCPQIELIPEIEENLVTVIPSGVTSFDQVNETSRIPLIGIVVAGEKVSELVKGKFLGISQTRVNNLQLGTVWFTAENCAFVGVVVVATFLRRE
jgi:hypothetical protein